MSLTKPRLTPLDPAHGSVTIDDPIGLVRVSDSIFNGITGLTDVVRAVNLQLSDVKRNRAPLPDQ